MLCAYLPKNRHPPRYILHVRRMNSRTNTQMKNSLISKKHLIPGREYWCACNRHSELQLLKYCGHELFEESGSTVASPSIRVMFEGYVNINKSRIPKKYLVPKRCYWCRHSDGGELFLMRYESDGSFYSFAHDVCWDSKNVKVIFEDYEH